MIDKIREAVSGVLGGTEDGADGASAGAMADTDGQPAGESSGEGAEESSLFECPSCESVFVAVEKETCATCRTPVERIE